MDPKFFVICNLATNCMAFNNMLCLGGPQRACLFTANFTEESNVSSSYSNSHYSEHGPWVAAVMAVGIYSIYAAFRGN